MGLLSILKSVAKPAAVALAPATGGASLGALPFLSAAGGAATGAAGGMADERTRQNQFELGKGGIATSRYGIEQGAKSNMLALAEKGAMDRAQLGLAAPGARANQVIKGSIMENLKPAKITHPRATIPGMSGGLTPEVLSAIVRQSGKDLQGQASEALRTRSDIPATPDYNASLVAPPELPGYKDSGKAESLLGGGGLLASILGSLGKAGAGKLPGAKPAPVFDEDI